MERVISFCGLFVMMGLAWLMSAHRWRVSLRVIAGGLFLQFALGVIILKTQLGRATFEQMGAAIERALGYVDAGASFVFGTGFSEHYFAFRVLPTIIFFSSLMAVLYHFGIMQAVVKGIAIVMQRTLNTSGAESLSTAADIFVGQTESALVVRPYVDSMTDSELMALMIGGFATIAGGVLAAFVGMGISAVHLLTASFISAPAALVIAKIIQPEVGHPKTLGRVDVQFEKPSVNAIHAAALGAADGVRLAINVAAMLIAFLALIALANDAFGWMGRQAGQTWSFEAFLGWVFAPIAWSMGIPWSECRSVGELLGIKMVANEFIAYQRLGDMIKPESTVQLSERTQAITTYALCGFANFGSIGIQIGGTGSLAPSRQPDIARFGLRAMLGGTLATCMTACIAGVLL